ncbi:Transketolase [Komagataella phaffii CBS 7435]|uniref:Transketolase n=2 Tax=Komagataella phaffii TaxID=460519 RepID=C4QXK7_KOMPG|nr:Transketolase, similar to Tkl2p [Komagataella phaffii GS115]AOA60873.1 GQ67_02035T0 [Komagataella phaffii]CAH2446794.1 Transketolase [Komagataella phaffii CBS 7435]AOA66219.1 GQ68_02050T0 [Komagataella phaffii GS115]CAY67980.1 Transketolase, similar to Tkl2p [Komagataella phaffii GS115]CCA37054.1 Transketolase [Komagataella phaffii CBS 7435]
MSDLLAINTIRLLAVDTVAKANSGHPGAPMGLAPAAHTLFKQMRFNPRNPAWINRDRFVLSNGHACALLYTMLFLYGYDYTIDDLKSFRQLNSKTPGHPEAELPGVEVTTGPLGQGIANAVGLAIAQAQLAATYNKPNYELFSNYTYAFLGDGCLQEGVAQEAISLAGHLGDGLKLIAFWDDNQISIDGDTNVSFTEDVPAKFRAQGWEVLSVKDGNDDLEGIAAALAKAKTTNKPTLIRLPTIIGYGSLQQGTHGVHGSPLKPDDIKQLKKKFGFDPEQNFVVPREVTESYAKHVADNQQVEVEWNKLLTAYTKEYPELGQELHRRLDGKLPENWQKALPTYTVDDKPVASRKLSEIVLTSIEKELPELVGGSADLTGSNLTRWPDAVDFQPKSTGLGDFSGRYFRFGVREHGMGAIINGISAYGANFKAYGGTFLNFVSYASGAVRLSALSGHPIIWVATHDSIGLGEDGPTHQPIETLAHLRALPNLMVWRPADGNETSAAYLRAIESKHTPSIIALTRQNLPQLEHSSIEKAAKGGYTVYPVENPDIILVASGSEVSIAIDGAKKLGTEGVKASVVSIPDFFTFDSQARSYQLSVLPDGVPIMSVEVMSTFGWSKYSHEQFGINRFGISGPGPEIYKFFEFTAEGVADRASKVVQFYKGKELLSPLNKAFESVHA